MDIFSVSNFNMKYFLKFFIKVIAYWLVLILLILIVHHNQSTRGLFYYLIGAVIFYGISIMLLIEYLGYSLIKRAKINLQEKTIVFVNDKNIVTELHFNEIKKINLCASINVIKKTVSFDPIGLFYFYEVETFKEITLYFTPFTIDKIEYLFKIKPTTIKMAVPSITIYKIFKNILYND